MPDPAASSRPAAPAGLRILVLDDDVGLCDVACIWLRSLGHQPVGVHSPEEALARLAEPYDVLFTDVVMPGPMDGLDLARVALARQPALRVLITSGYAQSLLYGRRALPGPLLSKPYRKASLAAALDALF